MTQTTFLHLGALLLLPFTIMSCGGGESAGGDAETTSVVTLAGVLDESFTVDIGGTSDRGMGVAIDADGNIVVCGLTQVGEYSDSLVVRLKDGAFDPTFGDGNGYVILNGSPENDAFFALKFDSEQRIVLAGYAQVNGVNKAALARLNDDGSLDRTFGVDGWSILDIGEEPQGDKTEWQDMGLYDLEIQPDTGRIVAAGAILSGGQLRVFVTRVDSSGALDSSFGTSGVALADTGRSIEPPSGGKAMTCDGAGRIYATGWMAKGTTQTDCIVCRWTSEGKVDENFNAEGYVAIDFGYGRNDDGYGIAVQRDGTIVVAGSTVNANDDRDFAIAWLREDGAFDSSLGNEGKWTLDLGQREELMSLVLWDEHEILLGGTMTESESTQRSFFVASLVDGTLRTSFGAGGYLLTKLANRSSLGYNLARQGDKLVQVGTTDPDGRSDVGIVRYR